MENTCKDPVFGTMQYNHRWKKNQSILIFHQLYEIEITAAAYSGQQINETQRQRYLEFMTKQDAYLHKIEELLMQFATLSDSKHYFDTRFNVTGIDALHSVFKPTALLFDKEGAIVMLFDNQNDPENGVGVQVVPSEKVGLQDDFL